MTQTLIIEFIPTKQACVELVTKFGGQPVWLNEPQWPHSRETGRPMQFIGQVALDERIFPSSLGKMAYIFMSDEHSQVLSSRPDSGENAVIIQPSYEPPSIKVSPLTAGPTLYDLVFVPEPSVDSKPKGLFAWFKPNKVKPEKMIQQPCEFVTHLTLIDEATLLKSNDSKENECFFAK